MRHIIQKSATKLCELDPLPTIFIKQHLTVLLPLITRAVNVSITMGKFPDNLKEAILWPLLKNLGLDHLPQNYRPVWNLPYLGKLIESCVSDQFVQHTESTGNVEPFQSAYRANHSTKTALLKVKADLLDAMDGKEVVCLILLDLSVAFDTVSHNILLNHLHYWFGITDTALALVRDYLSNRTHRKSVEVDGKKAESHKVLLKQGVPQGSILGPLLFTLYISPIGDICCQHNINFDGYADDTQNYLSFRPDKHYTNKIRCKGNLERCISEVHTWMCTNLLKLNNNKTEFLLIWTRNMLNQSGSMLIKEGNDNIPSADKARNLGVTIDKHLNNIDHINNHKEAILWPLLKNLGLDKSTLFFVSRNIPRVHHLLDQDPTKIIVQALIMSKLDYCNILLIGPTKYYLQNLQKMQNMCCHIILEVRKYDPITPHLRNLHWLKIEQCIGYKISVVVYVCVHNLVPGYLKDLVVHPHRRHLRSSTFDLLPTIKFRTEQAHKPSFKSQGHRILNKLPYELKIPLH